MVSAVDIESAVNGRAVGGAPRYDIIEDICVDSRKCGKNALFVPLHGERTDGHYFIEQALSNGAVASFVDRGYWENHRDELIKAAGRHNGWFMIVDDTLSALQKTASAHMRGLDKLVTIGITGSNGKTTTKELIGSVLSAKYKTQVNEGNLNSEIGLCLAALRVKPEHELAVFEMGMNRKGEMDVLAEIVRPDYAVITNIGSAHIGLIGSKENIAAEKKRIFSYFDGSQTAFIYEKEPFFDYLSENVKGSVIPYGPESTEGFETFTEKGLKGSLLRLCDTEIHISLIGKHNLINCLAAVAVARSFDVDIETIKRGFERSRALFGRGEVIEGAFTVIRDCYNANPESFSEAVRFFNGLQTEGKKIAVVGPMNELGEFSESAHEELGELLASSTCSIILFTGDATFPAYETVRKIGPRIEAYWSNNVDELKDIMVHKVREGDLVLLKGSRTAELEKIGDALSAIEGGTE